MAEPTTSAGVAIAAGTITLTGSIFGIDYDMLLAGFFGGLISLSFLQPSTKTSVAATIASSSIAAGLFGPTLVVFGLHWFPFLVDLGTGMRLVSGSTIGLFFQSAIPAIIRQIGKWEYKP
jgi:hypothetical protein